MATETTRTPAYGSFKSFNSYFTSRREDGHVTDIVDRSLMTNFSGSTATELIGVLKFLRMIDEKGKPFPLYGEYLGAADEPKRKELLGRAVRDAYDFVFSNPPFNVEKATTATTAELFRAQGVSGSTLSRAIGFFLAAAKDAGIKVSPNIKPPVVIRMMRTRRPAANGGNAAAPIQEREEEHAEDDLKVEAPPKGYQAFDIPIPINRRVRILIPPEWSASDWDVFQTMLTAYVAAWKQMSPKRSIPEKEDLA